MDIELSHDTVIVAETKVPLPWHRYTVPNAEVSYREYRAGRILRQVLRGTGYSVYCFRVEMYVSGPLEWRPTGEEDGLLYMRENAMTLETTGGLRVVADAGSFLPVRWEADRAWTVLSAGSYTFLLLAFDVGSGGDGVESLLFPDGAESEDHARGFPITPQIREVLDDICNKVCGWRQRKLLVESGVRRLLSLYFEALEKRRREGVGVGQQEMLLMLEEYMEAHLDEPLTVARLARKALISRSWLQRIAKEYYGKGICEVVRDRRMSEAGRLLVHSTLSIGTIASRVSDMGLSAFSATFKKHFGQTPRAYRRNQGRSEQTSQDDFTSSNFQNS